MRDDETNDKPHHRHPSRASRSAAHFLSKAASVLETQASDAKSRALARLLRQIGFHLRRAEGAA